MNVKNTIPDKTIMKIPPVSVYTKQIPDVDEMFLQHLGLQVDTIILDEQCAYVSFMEVEPSATILKFIDNLSCNIRIRYRDNWYLITPQYLDI